MAWTQTSGLQVDIQRQAGFTAVLFPGSLKTGPRDPGHEAWLQHHHHKENKKKQNNLPLFKRWC